MECARADSSVGKPSHLSAAVCPRTFHWIPSPRKLQDL